MKKIIGIIILLVAYQIVKAQTGYSCQDAIPLTNLKNSCSDSAQYSNAAPSQNGQTWFKFTADTTGVYVTINGKGAGGTLATPKLKLLLANCNGDTVAGTSSTTNNVTTFFSDQIQRKVTYYILVTGSNNQTGSFKLCINSVPAADAPVTCARAAYLCTMADYTITRGLEEDTVLDSYASLTANAANEKGTCIMHGEYGGFWFKWKAANSGTLAFNITPQSVPSYHIFLLYDLGTSPDCTNANAANVIRCMGWSPVFCGNGQVNPIGLSFTENDISESAVCGQGQNGRLKYVDMIQGHYYALAVNVDYAVVPNIISNIGFTLSFTDENGKSGTGQFAPADPAITYTSINAGCTSDRTYTFTCSNLSYQNLRWDFGDGVLQSADANRNFTVHYNTSGNKTVKLYAGTGSNCLATAATSFVITDNSPQNDVKPNISVNKKLFCIGDTVILSSIFSQGLTYLWTGPDNFKSKQPIVTIPVNNASQAGTYTLTAYDGLCPAGAAAAITIMPFLNRPESIFTTSPSLPANVKNPATVQFVNESVNADSYLWDFGDGSRSAEANPSHEYTQNGSYKITLTAYQSTACSSSETKGILTISVDGGISNTMFIPNVFTPNGDGINDNFAVTVSNIANFHLQVFNRYGRQVFESKNEGNKWDGNLNGKQLPEGTYYYILNTTDTSGKISKASGPILLLR